MLYLATNLNEDEYKRLRNVFLSIDSNKNGTISANEFHKYFHEAKLGNSSNLNL
jgi:Ca2+-binding EF-hand superfamily protein